MNEGKKTLAFWAAAGVMLGIGTWVAWPTEQVDSNPIAGSLLFENFTDPQSAASMKIVSFDDEQGQLDTFEVRRDRETGLWNIPSRDGYPADAIEQMRTAANSLVGLKILDVQTSNAEDHDDLGVAEPSLEDLEVGDEGIGRLVTFKNEAQETLGSIIIGDQDKSDPEKRYVRIPGQDPVYVVKLDLSPLSTKFGDWIESDLLKLSSIDIEEVEIQDYTAAVGGRGELALNRSYTANLKLEGTEWKLEELNEFEPDNPRAEPIPVEIAEDETLNKTKLDAMKNALDDLKIANVLRKPEGMSASLRASQDFLDDTEALRSLMKNGFLPAGAGPDGDVEIFSANGELSVTLKDGVKYVMRFGNIAGVSSDDEPSDDAGSESEDETSKHLGVNRYLMVTTMVDQSKFHPPELREVPKTIEELKSLLTPQKPEPPPAEESEADEPSEADESGAPADTDDSAEMTDESKSESAEEPADEPSEPADEPSEPADEPSEPAESEPDDEPAEPADEPETDSVDEPAESDSAGEAVKEGESESTGSGEASGSGEARQDDDESDSDPADEGSTDTEESADEDPAKADEPAESVTEDDVPAAETESAAEPTNDDAPVGEATEEEELTDEEWQERLEAEQEKITKENQRKLDARKDQIEEAEKKVRELNGRFADWYYVIAEDTYAKLRIKRADLLEKKSDESSQTPPAGFSPGAAGPQFNIPGLPGN